MALDILTILIISNNWKQAFNKASNFLELYYLKFHPNIITALQCSYSYKRMGFKRFSTNSKFAIIYIGKSWHLNASAVVSLLLKPPLKPRLEPPLKPYLEPHLEPPSKPPLKRSSKPPLKRSLKPSLIPRQAL